MRILKSEARALLDREPRINEAMNSLQGLRDLPRAVHRDTEISIALARKFNDEVVRPACRAMDLHALGDHDFLPRDFIAAANEWGLYSLWIPRFFGGGGMDLVSLYPFLEEIASVCTGLANVIGVHYLGVGTLSASWNLRLMNSIMREVCSSSGREKEACLLSLAITEPAAGTDVEETELLDHAVLGTTAERVKGGYLLNGRKVFISNGHVSTWHMVIAYGDRKRAAESTVMAAVRTGTKGFSFGRQEKKMGQRACPASELIFEDCFVPDKLICASPEHHRGRKTQRQASQTMVDFVVSSSRTGVGAFAAGAARGAYETAFEYARGALVDGDFLLNKQWAQTALAEMYAHANTARALYMESAYANALKGLFWPLYIRPVYYLTRAMPRLYFRLISPLLRIPVVNSLARRRFFDGYSDDDRRVSSGWASLSKFAASDLAVKNAELAMELMGAEGLRHDRGAEKHLRDAKLLQIYEGTNQLNRLNVVKNLVAHDAPGTRIFK